MNMCLKTRIITKKKNEIDFFGFIVLDFVLAIKFCKLVFILFLRYEI